MSIIASTSINLKLHQWSNGLLHHTYTPSKHDEGPIKSISWNKDGSWIVLVPYGGPAEIIGIKNNVKLLQTIADVHHPICATFQNTTKRLISLSAINQIFIYDIKKRKIKKRFPKTTPMIHQLEYNENDSHLAASCDNGKIFMYNNTTLHIIGSYQIPQATTVSTIRFHSTKRNYFGAGSEEGVVAVWDINPGLTVTTCKIHHAPITSLAFSPNSSNLLVTGGLDRRFAFHDFLSKEAIFEMEVMHSITALDFSYCGTHLGLGTANGSIILYDIRKLNSPLSTIKAHNEKYIRHLVFQKILLGKDLQDDSSDFEVVKNTISEPQSEQDSILSGVSIELNLPNKRKRLQDKGDSFLSAMGCNSSSQTELEQKDSIGPKKWTDTSKFVRTEEIGPLLTPGPVSCNPISSTPTFAFQDPLVPIASPITCLQNSSTVTQTQEAMHETNYVHISPNELRKIVRDAIREELGTQMKEFENSINMKIFEIHHHLNCNFFDMQMSIVKQFLAIENIIEKLNNGTIE